MRSRNPCNISSTLIALWTNCEFRRAIRRITRAKFSAIRRTCHVLSGAIAVQICCLSREFQTL
jgi:hypothetical protein